MAEGMKVRYRKRAISDLHGIATHTQEQWGSEKARAYLLTLRRACETLGRFPELGRASMVPGYRCLTVERHVIYYRADGNDVVLVVRILHERRRPRRKL